MILTGQDLTPDARACGMSLEIAAAATSELTSASDAAGSGGAARRNGDTRHGRGARLIRLGRELSPPIFGALIDEYQRVLRDVMLRMGGRQFKVSQDTAIALFPNAKLATLAAVALQNVVAAHELPHKRDVAVSVGVHSAQVGSGCCRPIRCRVMRRGRRWPNLFLPFGGRATRRRTSAISPSAILVRR